MAKYIPDENTIRLITEKYVKSMTRDVENIPDIVKVITEALQDAAPEREVDPNDVEKVVKILSTQNIVNDKAISEAAKKVADNSAHEDLVFSINQYIKQLKLTKSKKPTEKDVEEIIKFGKLDPYTSTPFQIKNAVRDYFAGARPVEAMPDEEIRDIVKTELAKRGPVDERDVVAIVKLFLAAADKEKPLDIKEIKSAVEKHLAGKPTTSKPEPITPVEPDATTRPGTTPVVRPPLPGAPVDPSATPTPPAPRTGKNKVEAGEYVPPVDPKNMSFFEKIRKKMERYGLKMLTKTARNWLEDTVRASKTSPPRKKLLTQGTPAMEMVGCMFMYFYDAKTKDELPYWDKFPLIFMIDLLEDGWLGLNLHYLPLNLRIRLFDRLLQFANNKSIDDITKLKLSYGLIKNVSQFPEARPCIKRYLSGNVRSDLIKVAPIDWEIAVFLPVEQFVKQPKETVWKDSRKKIRGKK